MGFVVNDDTYLLKFTDGKYAGMEVEVQPLDVANMIEMSSVERSDGIGGKGWYDIASRYFIKSLVRWNLEYRDHATGETHAIPRTAEGMQRVSLAQFLAIYRAWMRELSAPSEDPDLGKDSSSGAPSLVELPMTEPSSPSQPS